MADINLVNLAANKTAFDTSGNADPVIVAANGTHNGNWDKIITALSYTLEAIFTLGADQVLAGQGSGLALKKVAAKTLIAAGDLVGDQLSLLAKEQTATALAELDFGSGSSQTVRIFAPAEDATLYRVRIWYTDATSATASTATLTVGPAATPTDYYNDHPADSQSADTVATLATPSGLVIPANTPVVCATDGAGGASAGKALIMLDYYFPEAIP